MKLLSAVVCCISLSFLIGCSSQPETLVHGGYDVDEMAAATERAIAEVDEFIAELKSGGAENYAVKAPIEDAGETEHFWITDVRFADGKFTGLIGNDPGIVSNVELGQEWSLGKTDISDWMYMRDGKMYGNYTLRPLLACDNARRTGRAATVDVRHAVVTEAFRRRIRLDGESGKRSHFPI